MDDMQCMRSLDYCISHQPTIEWGQLAIVRASQRQQITVGDVGGIQETRGIHVGLVEEGNIVGPKGMARQLDELSQQAGYCRWRTGRVWIAGVVPGCVELRFP